MAVNKYILIGDVHGNLNAVGRACNKHPDANRVIQVGDLGIGFGCKMDRRKRIKCGANFAFIHGNHDNPDLCAEFPQFLGRYGVLNSNIFFVSGAMSTDKDSRTPMIDWWANEELSYVESVEAIELYKRAKPEVVITHDCPFSLLPLMYDGVEPIRSFTGILLDELFKIHQPSLWVFGHHHTSNNYILNKTVFRCLGCNEIMELKA